MKKIIFCSFIWRPFWDVLDAALPIWYRVPPLVQRAATARMGYLKVLELSKQILLLGLLASVRTVNSQWGRRLQFLYMY
jgi:hypothetical protein